ncbi:hypothetical protein CHS0354_039247 [Potamilus streckersoni]|uniref:Tetraspanin n=1 Tax=Potamilus streckersoni TaxID=2493646 RepID=A0AAE0VGG4_9BIVA|nr:hypothetical protein CHS0354_039247 [Potamilus streckersoni]
MDRMLTKLVLGCTKEKCSRIGFMVMNIIFSAFGVALLTGSCIVGYDHSMADNYLSYSSFQKALETANVNVHTPSSLNIGETLDVVCIVFIVIGVLFLLLGILGLIGAIFRLKVLLITLEGWIRETLKDSIRNNYTGISGNDTDTLRWNFVMHSFQCCGVDRYTDFRTLPAAKWNTEIEYNGLVTGKQIPFACCQVKNDTTCVLKPNSTTAFIKRSCYQVMRNWVTNNTGVMVAVGVIILVTEIVLVVLAFLLCCTSRKKTYEKDREADPPEPCRLPQAHLVLRNQDLFNPSGVFMNPVYDGPTFHNHSVESYPPRQSRELFNHYNDPNDAYDNGFHEQDSYTGSLNESVDSLKEPPWMSFATRLSSDNPYAKPMKRELRTGYPEQTAAYRTSGYLGSPPSEYC